LDVNRAVVRFKPDDNASGQHERQYEPAQPRRRDATSLGLVFILRVRTDARTHKRRNRRREVGLDLGVRRRRQRPSTVSQLN